MFVMHYSSMHQHHLRVILETFHHTWRCLYWDQWNCIIGIYSLIVFIDGYSIMRLWLFCVVFECFQDYLTHDEVPLANWELAQMDGGYSNCIKWTPSLITTMEIPGVDCQYYSILSIMLCSECLIVLYY